MAGYYRGVDTTPLATSFREPRLMQHASPTTTRGGLTNRTAPRCRYLLNAQREVQDATRINPPDPTGHYTDTAKRRTQHLVTRRVLGIDPWLGEPTGQRMIADLVPMCRGVVWESPCSGKEGHFEGALMHLPYTSDRQVWDQIECNAAEMKSSPCPAGHALRHTFTAYCGTCGTAFHIDFNNRTQVFAPWPVRAEESTAETRIELDLSDT